MANSEVEIVLREIKERVRAEQRRAPGVHPGIAGPTFTAASGDPLARLRANIVITERAWNKLPPVTSFNRQGWSARLEVWVKRQIKRVTSWYTFEQINFNGAVNGALHATAGVLEHSLNEQRVCQKQLALQISEQRVILDRARRSLDLRMDELRAGLEELRAVQAEVQQRSHDVAPR